MFRKILHIINKLAETQILIVFNVPVSGSLKVKPANKTIIKKAYFLNEPDKVLQLEKLDYGASFILMPKDFKANKPFVIVLETKAGNENYEGPKAKT
jgi:hypothetical protein